MGMDVFGLAPTAPEGEYFRRNVWGWRPIANFIIETRPEIATRLRRPDGSGATVDEIGQRTIDGWHYNDGCGLDVQWSIRLADALDEMLSTGEAEAYVNVREAMLKQLPCEICSLCEGTGLRSVQPGRQRGIPECNIAQEEDCTPDHPAFSETDWCGRCNGRGSLPNWETYYHVDLDDIREFSAFLRASGGFQIW